MAEYKQILEETMGKVQEPAVVYGGSSSKSVTGISSKTMDELLQQSDEVKLKLINILAESMTHSIRKRDAIGKVELAEALQFVKTLSKQGKMKVPIDEKGISALLNEKYGD